MLNVAKKYFIALSYRFPVLDLLAIGSDTVLLLQLLLYSSSMAPRSILHSSNNNILGGTRKDNSGSVFIDGIRKYWGERCDIIDRTQVEA